MAKEVVRCLDWAEIGPALDAGKRPWIEFTCGICEQRVAEEFHSVVSTTYHRVAEEECAWLRERVATLERLVREVCRRHGEPLPLAFFLGILPPDAPG